MKINMGVGARDRGGQLAHSARLISPRLQSWLRIAHFAFDLALGVSAATESINQYVDRARTHQVVSDFERLLAGVGLGNQEVVEIDAKLARIDGIKRMFSVDKGANAAFLFCVPRSTCRGQRRLA